MLIDVKVIPRASKNFIKDDGTRLKAYVTAPADKGRANQAVLELLSEYFQVRKSDIKIIRGEFSSLKTLEIQTAHACPLNPRKM